MPKSTAAYLGCAGIVDEHEDVAGVHVGMKEVVPEHLREKDLHAVFGKPADVGAGFAQARHVGDLHAADPLHDHDRGPAEVPMHRRHVQQRRVLEIAAQLRGVACFAHQVELIENGFRVFVHHFHGLEAAAAFPVRFGDARQLAQHLEIARDDGVHAGPQDLDHDFAGLRAIERDFRAQLRGVHLRDGSGGQRRFFENGEHLFGGAAIGAFDDGARHLAVERRHAILQLGEFVGDVDGQQVAPRRQRLAELHEDRVPALRARGAGVRRAAHRRVAPPRSRATSRNRKRSGRYR